MTEPTAPHNLYGIDGEGVRRFVAAGDPIPAGLVLEDESIKLDRRDLTPEEKRLAAEKAARGETVAPEDLYATDPAGIRRFIAAGTTVPVGYAVEDVENYDWGKAGPPAGPPEAQGPVGGSNPATSTVAAPASDAGTDVPDELKPDDGPGIDDYDDLTAEQIIEQLGQLDADGVARAQAYEAAHKDRKTIADFQVAAPASDAGTDS